MSDETDGTNPPADLIVETTRRRPHKIIKRLRLLRKQAEMLAYRLKWGAARGGTRAGKSVGWAIWLFSERIQKFPLANHVVVGADYEQLRRGFFDLMIGLLDSFGWEEGVDYRYRESPSPMIFFTRLGKRVRLRSLSTKLVERIRGMSIQTLLLEEPQTWGTKAMSGKKVFEILVGRLSHSQTTAILYPEMETQGRMSFNPPAEGTWLYQLIEEQWPAEGYKCWKMSVRENWLLHDLVEYVHNLEINLDPRRHPSEIDGEWALGGGGVYYGYDPTVHANPPDGIPGVDWIDPDQPFVWTHDFNAQMMCSIIGQQFDQIKTRIPNVNPEVPRDQQFTMPVPTWQPTILRALDEICDEDSSSPQVLEKFLASRWFKLALEYQERTGKESVHLHGDPSGGGRSQTADARGAARSNWLVLLNGLRGAGLKVKLCYARSDPGQKNRVNDVNAQFGTKAGPGMTVDPKTCKVLVADWREMKWDATGMKLVKVAGEIGDASDAWAYWVSQVRKTPSTYHVAVAKNR